MKDIQSMLQSRLAKGSNFINEYSEYSYPFNMIEEQTHADQKLMKQALAEIVALRRELRKEESRREALHNFHLDLLGKHKTLIENLKKKLKVE